MTQLEVFDMPKVHTIKRTATRRVLRADNSDIAAQAIGTLTHGDELFLLTAGNFSLIDVLLHLLDLTGPAEVDCATWTQGVYDQQKCAALRTDGRIKKMRWLVDPSMFARRPELSGKLVERFGEDSFRAVSIHAKYLVIRGEHMNIAVRSSMNMNENEKIEQLDISVCDKMAEFLTQYTDSTFAAISQASRSNSRKVFAQVLAQYKERGDNAPESGSFADRFGVT